MTDKTVKLGLQETWKVMHTAYCDIDLEFMGLLAFSMESEDILEDETKTDNEKFVAIKELFLRDRENFAKALLPDPRRIREATQVLIRCLLDTDELDLELPASTVRIFRYERP